MNDKILDYDYRKKVIEETRSTENDGRKAESLQQVEIFNDRILQHVKERLKRNFEEGTISEMPLVSSLNLARRIAKQEASIYKSPPKRSFTNLSDDQRATVELIYKDMGINSKLLKSNESFKLQNQNHIMIIPSRGKLCLRVLRNHHLDAIPSDLDPEVSDAYLVSSYDKGTLLEKRNEANGGDFDSKINQNSNQHNETIGDPEDYKSERWAWWSDTYNFTTDGMGEIVTGIEADEIKNHAEINPIIDVSIEKDFEYWVRQGESLTEFTVEYNAFWSNVMQIVMMQGFAQAYLKGPEDLLPSSLVIGPNHILKLAVDPENPVDIEFGYASPNPDLAGTIQAGEAMLATFLTSRGLDSTLVSGSGNSKSFSSGIERLLSMIETFDASKSDYDIYKRTEDSIYKLVKAWHNNLKQTNQLDKKYITTDLPEDSEVELEFAGPEMIQSESEKLEIISTKIELGVMSTLDAISEIRGVDKDGAKEILEEVKTDEIFVTGEEEDGDNKEGINQDSESQGTVEGDEGSKKE